MSFTHCVGLSTDASSFAAGLPAEYSGAKPTWMWSAWSPSASVLSVPG